MGSYGPCEINKDGLRKWGDHSGYKIWKTYGIKDLYRYFMFWEPKSILNISRGYVLSSGVINIEPKIF